MGSGLSCADASSLLMIINESLAGQRIYYNFFYFEIFFVFLGHCFMFASRLSVDYIVEWVQDCLALTLPHYL